MSFASTFDDPPPGRVAAPPAWLLALLALLLAFHALRAWQVTLTQPTDFRIFYEASIDLHHGADPYADSPRHLAYIYPPLLAWSLGPLTALPLPAAAEVWVVLTFAAWIVLGAMTVKLSRSDHGGHAMWIALVPSLLAYRFVLRLNLHGQVDLLLWAVVAGSLLALHHKRDRLSGGLLGLALVIKPLPVLFLGALVLRRRFAACAVALVTGALLLAAPALTVGPARLHELLGQWAAGRIGRDLTEVGFESHASNQSLQAFIYRYAAARPDGVPREGIDGPTEPWPAPIAALSPRAVNLCWLALVLAIAAPLPFLIGARPVSGRRFGVEAALLACTTHLVSRRTMEYHLVSLILVDAVLLGLALCPGVRPGWRRAAGATLAVGAFLQNFYAPPFVGRWASLAFQARGCATLSLVLAWGFLTCALARWENVTRLGGTKLPGA